MGDPRISLVIPAFNEEAYIGACIDSVTQNNPGKFFEIIVVDNGCTDRTKQIALERSGVRVVREEVLGSQKARQRGLDEAVGDLVAFIDADTRMPPRWAQRAQEIFNKYPGVVCLSGPYHYYDGSTFQRFCLRILWRISVLASRIIGYASLGGNFIARRSALLAMGGLDVKIKFYGDDTDTARRLSRLGKVLFRSDFYIESSMRRFESEGLVRTNLKYTLNFIWEVIFRRPFSSKPYTHP